MPPAALLHAIDAGGAKAWGSKGFVLTLDNGLYTLTNVSDEVLYQGPAAR